MDNWQHGFDGLIVGWGEAQKLLEAIKRTQFKLTTWLWQPLM